MSTFIAPPDPTHEFRAPQFVEQERTLPNYIKWQSIAFVVVLLTPAELLMRMHDLTKSQLIGLAKDPRFKTIINDTKEALAKGGAKATFKMRAGMIAEELLPELRRVAMSQYTDPKIKKDILDAMTRYAELDPSINKNKNDGVTVNFSFGGGMPGLSRLSGHPEVIDV